MERLFKNIVLSSYVLYVIWFFLPYIYNYVHDRDTLDALSWNGFGATIDFGFPIYYLFLGIYSILTLGLVYFKPWAKVSFVLFTAAMLLMVFISGVVVQTPLDMFLSTIITMLDGSILTMLYLTSVSDRFKRNV